MSKKFTISSAKLIFIGLFLGLLCGIVFREKCHIFEPISTGYLMLVRMTILPYVMVSLIHGIGSLSIADAKAIAFKGVLIIVFLMAMMIAIIFALSYAFPPMDNAMFYSSSTLAAEAQPSILKTFIPENLFYSLSQSLVPAIIVFSICFGMALISIKDKEPLLNVLSVASQSLMRISKGILRFLPIGIFFIVSEVVGTINIKSMYAMQIYLICYILAAVIPGFFTIPFLVSSVTPISFRNFYKLVKEPLLMAFITENAFIIIPTLIDKCITSLKPHVDDEEKIISETNTFIPVTYNIPIGGTLLPLLFILFVSWFYNHPLTILDDAKLSIFGVFCFFGSSMNAIPFLLNNLGLPADSFNLFVVSYVLLLRIKIIPLIMSLAAFSMIASSVTNKVFKVRWMKMLANLIITSLLIIICIIALRYFYKDIGADLSQNKEIVTSMKIEDTVPAKVYLKDPPASIYDNDDNSDDNTVNLINQIKQRGVLRVGYNASSMPFAYFNRFGELVGYDIAFAHKLAKDLGCTLEFIPFSYGNVIEKLQEGRFDIAMSAVSLTNDRLEDLFFSTPYLELDLAFVVKDYQRKKFAELANISDDPHLRIAVIEGSAYIDIIHEVLPKAKIVEIKERKIFFEKDIADAMITTEIQGTSFALLYPYYSVVTPTPPIQKDFLAYPISQKHPEALQYFNYWVKLQKLKGFSKEQYSYWILGKDATQADKID